MYPLAHWYCLFVGLVGNILTLTLLLKRIICFKRGLISREFKPEPPPPPPTSSIDIECNNDTSHLPGKSQNDEFERRAVHIRKRKLIDRRNNWTLYYYIVGIIMSDILMFISSIMEYSTIPIKVKTEVGYQVTVGPADSDKMEHMMSSVDLAHFATRLNLVNSTGLSSAVLGGRTIDNMSFVTLDSILNVTSHATRYSTGRLIDLSGFCQLYYYFSIISMHGSFSFTIACLLDRIVKLKIIDNEIRAHKSDLNRYYRLEYQFKRRDSNDHADSNSMAKSSIFKLLKSTDLKSLTKSKYSELVKQLFGKTSAYFIALFVFLFYFHLVWIYATVPEFEEESLGDYPAYFYQSNKLVEPVVDNRTTYPRHYYSFGVRNEKYKCTLVGYNNRLPYVIMNIDSMLLLVLCVLKLILAIVLICQYSKVRRKRDSKRLARRNNFTRSFGHSVFMKMSSTDSKPSGHHGSIDHTGGAARSTSSSSKRHVTISLAEKSKTSTKTEARIVRLGRNRPVFVNCVLWTSLLGALCEMPSVLVRDLFLLTYLFSLSSTSPDSTPTEAVVSQDYLSNLNSTSNMTLVRETSETSSSDQVMNMSHELLRYLMLKFDLILIIFSSHKFLLFLFGLYLVRFPKIRLPK